jgi:preprotein translocase subunit SecE
MTQPMNRQTKRLMAKQENKPGEKRARPAPGADVKREKTGPRQFLSEVRSELKKVAWPTRKEVVNSTIVVLIAVVFMTALIFGFDYASSKFVLFLFD